MVRKCFFIFIIILGIARPALAAFHVPSSVYTIYTIDKAQTQALNQNKPLTFLYSDKATTCSLCTSASADIIYSLDKHSIIVYIQHSDWQQIPPLVQNAINSPAAGKYIPITVIVNPQVDKAIYILPYQRYNRILLIDEAKDKIKEYFANSSK